MSFSWITFLLLLYSFSSSLSVFLVSLSISLSELANSFRVFFTASDLLMMVSISCFTPRNPSIPSKALIASSLLNNLDKVLLSTLTSSADSHLLANSVEEIPCTTISNISAAFTSTITLPS